MFLFCSLKALYQQQGNINHGIELTNRILKYRNHRFLYSTELILNNYFSLEPDHERSKSNLAYYSKIQSENLKKIRGDVGLESEQEPNINMFEVINSRPPSILGYERELYESLCRSDEITFKDVCVILRSKVFRY